jgi:hypothetical protein
LSDFDSWYQTYPRPEARAAAERAWVKLNPAERQECATRSPDWIKADTERKSLRRDPPNRIAQRRGRWPGAVLLYSDRRSREGAMQRDQATLLKEWTGKEVRVTTVGDKPYDGVLESPGNACLTLLYRGEPMLIAWSAVVTMGRRPKGASEYNARTGETTER